MNALAQFSPIQRANLETLKWEFPVFAPNCLRIRDKEGAIHPFRLNRAQKHIHDRLEEQRNAIGRVRAIIVKARQVGCSTYIEGRFYHRLWGTSKSLRAFILTHEQPATDNLFGMAERFAALHPQGMGKPPIKTGNAKELIFGHNDCGYQVSTAGTKETGRSATFQLFHGCLGINTPVIGPRGSLCRIGDVEEGFRVRTRMGTEAYVSFVSRQRKTASRVLLKGLGDFPLDATPDHRFHTAAGWRHLSELAVGDAIGFPIAHIVDAVRLVRFRLPDTPRPQGGGTRETGPDQVRMDYALGRVLGLYVAEGCIIKQAKSGVPSAVSFAVHEREAARTLEWLKPLRALYRHEPRAVARKNTKTVTVTVYGHSFATFVREMCGELDWKALPKEWKWAGEQFARGMVHGYLAGDGNSSVGFGDRRISATSIRSAITVEMRDALAALGYGWSSICHKKAAVRHGRNEREAWVLRLCGVGVDRLCGELGWDMPIRQRHGAYGDIRIADGFAWIPIKSIEPLGEIEVVDLEIDDPDHSYLTLHGASHNSETAFWPNAQSIASGAFNTVGRAPGTEIILESTGNGVNGFFYKTAQAAIRGESEFIAIFVPWFWDDGCCLPCPDTWATPKAWQEYGQQHKLEWDQLYWAFVTNRESANAISASHEEPCWLFKQEFPATFDEAFQSSGNSFIPPASVIRARRPVTPIIGSGMVILGVDPARNVDRVGLIDRCGRRAGERICQRMDPSGSSTYVADQICQVIDRLTPDMVNIDVGSNGGPVYDIIFDRGYGEKLLLNPVNFGSNPISKGPTGQYLFANRRAEMWDGMRAWFDGDLPVQIPDDDTLQGDICAPQWGPPPMTRRSANNELFLEEKEAIKARIGASPDLGDALALTFAVPYFTEKQSAMTRSAPRRVNRRSGY